MGQVIVTPQRPLTRLRTTSETSTAFVALPPTTTKPVTDPTPTGVSQVVYDVSKPSPDMPQWLRILPFGSGSDGNTFAMRVIGWTVSKDAVSTPIWTPVTIAEFTCTLGAAVGVAGATVLDTEKYCDTITMVFGIANVNNIISSPANDTPASVLVLLDGCSLVSVQFDMVTATGGNALISTE